MGTYWGSFRSLRAGLGEVLFYRVFMKGRVHTVRILWMLTVVCVYG